MNAKLRRTLTPLVLCAAIVGCGGSESAETPAPKKQLVATRGLLAVGESVPELKCAGWTNGEMPAFGAGGAKLHVLDIWASW